MKTPPLICERRGLVGVDVLGALTTEDTRPAMFGSLTKVTGFFYDSHNKNRAAYKTHHIDGRKSGRVSRTYVQLIIDMYGEESNAFRVRVAGDFPKSMRDSFIPME